MKIKNNQSGIAHVAAILVIVVLVAIGLVGWKVWDNSEKKNNNNSSNDSSQTKSYSPSSSVADIPEKSTDKKALSAEGFGNTGDYGTFQAEGYAKTVKVDDTSADCGMSNPDVACPKMDAIFFVVVSTPNTHILDYLKKGHLADSPDSSFQMGCLKDSSITYTNSSDDGGKFKAYTVTKSDSTKLTSATATKPIAVEIVKQNLTFGTDAPTCYSDFTSYKLIKK